MVVVFLVVTERPARFLLKPGGAPLWYQIVVPADNRRVGNAKHVGNLLDRAVVVDCLGLFHVFHSRLFFDIRNVAFPTFRVNKTYLLLCRMGYMTTIHERIKVQRKLAGLTQVELAKIVGVAWVS